eukprot:gene19681-23542_t
MVSKHDAQQKRCARLKHKVTAVEAKVATDSNALEGDINSPRGSSSQIPGRYSDHSISTICAKEENEEAEEQTGKGAEDSALGKAEVDGGEAIREEGGSMPGSAEVAGNPTSVSGRAQEARVLEGHGRRREAPVLAKGGSGIIEAEPLSSTLAAMPRRLSQIPRQVGKSVIGGGKELYGLTTGAIDRRVSSVMKGITGATSVETELKHRATKDRAVQAAWEEAFKPESNLVDEYMKQMILMGYGMLFAIVFPLSPLVAALNCYVEIRLNLRKLITSCRCASANMQPDLPLGDLDDARPQLVNPISNGIPREA